MNVTPDSTTSGDSEDDTDEHSTSRESGDDATAATSRPSSRDPSQPVTSSSSLLHRRANRDLKPSCSRPPPRGERLFLSVSPAQADSRHGYRIVEVAPPSPRQVHLPKLIIPTTTTTTTAATATTTTPATSTETHVATCAGKPETSVRRKFRTLDIRNCIRSSEDTGSVDAGSNESLRSAGECESVKVKGEGGAPLTKRGVRAWVTTRFKGKLRMGSPVTTTTTPSSSSSSSSSASQSPASSSIGASGGSEAGEVCVCTGYRRQSDEPHQQPVVQEPARSIVTGCLIDLRKINLEDFPTLADLEHRATPIVFASASCVVSGSGGPSPLAPGPQGEDDEHACCCSRCHMIHLPAATATQPPPLSLKPYPNVAREATAKSPPTLSPLSADTLAPSSTTDAVLPSSSSTTDTIPPSSSADTDTIPPSSSSTTTTLPPSSSSTTATIPPSSSPAAAPCSGQPVQLVSPAGPKSVHTQIDYIHCLVPDLDRIANATFYWGVMDRYEAERLLENKPEGTFLLRDSAQEDFLFSVSFRRYSRSLHARIEQWNYHFSFDSHDPGVFASPTVHGLIEHYKDPSCCLFFEPMLTIPLNRNFVFSLQHLSRAVIVSRTAYDGVGQLPLPKSLKLYLKEYHYKQKVRVRRFESDYLPPQHQQQFEVYRPRLPVLEHYASNSGTNSDTD